MSKKKKQSSRIDIAELQDEAEALKTLLGARNKINKLLADIDKALVQRQRSSVEIATLNRLRMELLAMRGKIRKELVVDYSNNGCRKKKIKTRGSDKQNSEA